ncbi:YqzL family protein [Massilibacterium senegalense]|nr:YqzL family protein [Massilibacterium senegalense]
MLEFTWHLFKVTGNIDTYLLLKEMEKESDEWSQVLKLQEKLDSPVSP